MLRTLKMSFIKILEKSNGIPSQAPGKCNIKIKQAESACSGGIPDIDPFVSDFTEVTTNVHWLMDSIDMRGFKKKKGVVTGPTNAPCLNICHLLFKISTCVTL